jgi:hypothetical protein
METRSQETVSRKRIDEVTFLSLPQKLRWRIYYQRAEDDVSDADHSERDRERDRGLRHLFALGCRGGITFAYARNDGVASFASTLDLLRSYNELRLINRIVNSDILPCICSRYLILIHGSARLQVPQLSSACLLQYCRNIAIDLTHGMLAGSLSLLGTALSPFRPRL